MFHAADHLADDREGVVPNLAVGTQVVGADDDVARVDLLALHELLDVDGAGRFKRDVLELVLGDLDVGVGIDLLALDDVLVRDLFARLGVHARVLDAVAGVLVDLVETDLFGIGSGWIEREWTGDERQTQEAFPIGAGCNERRTSLGAAWIQDDPCGHGSGIPPGVPVIHP
jgi:hypothetical protein